MLKSSLGAATETAWAPLELQCEQGMDKNKFDYMILVA